MAIHSIVHKSVFSNVLLSLFTSLSLAGDPSRRSPGGHWLKYSILPLFIDSIDTPSLLGAAGDGQAG